MPAPGSTTLYRQPPRNFDDLFIRYGWSSIEAETRAHARTIAKWLGLRNEERAAGGEPSLQEARRGYVAQYGPARCVGRVTSVRRRELVRLAG